MADVEKDSARSRVATPSTEIIPFPTTIPWSDSSMTSSKVGSRSPRSLGPHQDEDGEHWVSRQGIFTVFGAFLALLCTFGQMNAFGTFLAYYKDHQLASYSSTVISWIGSIQLFVFFVSGIPAGICFDRYGPKPLLVLGSVAHVLSMVLISVSTNYWHLVLTHGFLFGLGVALVFYPCIAAVSSHYHHRPSTALGLVLAGSGIGGVLYPIALQKLFIELGFGWAIRVCAAVSALFCLIACFAVCAANHPQSLVPFCKEHETDGLADSERESCPPWTRLQTLKDRVYVMLILGNLLVSLGIFIPYFFISSYTRTLPTPPSPALSFYTLSIMNAAGVVGRFLLSILADSLGAFNLLALSGVCMGIATLTLWLLSKSMTLVILYAIAYGFCSGGFIALVNPCVVSISSSKVIGRRIGGLYTLVAFPALVGNPLGALLLDRFNGSYRNMVVFSGVSMILGSMMLVLARWQRSERRLWVAV